MRYLILLALLLVQDVRYYGTGLGGVPAGTSRYDFTYDVKTGLYGYWAVDETSGTRVLTAGSAASANFSEIGGTVPSAPGVFGKAISSEWTYPDTTPGLRARPTAVTVPSGFTLAVRFYMRSDGLPASQRMNLFSLFYDTNNPPDGYLVTVYRYCTTSFPNYIGATQVNVGIGELGIAPGALGPFTMDAWHIVFAWWTPADNSLHLSVDNLPDASTVTYDFSAKSIAEIRVGMGVGNFVAWHGYLDAPIVWLRQLTPAERSAVLAGQLPL